MRNAILGLGAVLLASATAFVFAGGEQCKQAAVAASCDKSTLVSTSGGEQAKAGGSCCGSAKTALVSTTGEQCTETKATAAKASCDDKTTLTSTGGECKDAKATLTSTGGECKDAKSCDTKETTLVSTDSGKPIEALKSLAGKWASKDAGEHGPAATEFKVSSNGSAIVETMFPGTTHEMTNVFTMDGDRLLLTHYCAGGNAPRMQMTKQEGNTYTFEFLDATNLPDRNKMHMNGLELTIEGNDKIVEKWSSSVEGKTAGHAVFTMERAK